MECTCPKPEAKLQTENQKPAQKNAIIMVHHVGLLDTLTKKSIKIMKILECPENKLVT